jgi:hypothetical protein
MASRKPFPKWNADSPGPLSRIFCLCGGPDYSKEIPVGEEKIVEKCGIYKTHFIHARSKRFGRALRRISECEEWD